MTLLLYLASISSRLSKSSLVFIGAGLGSAPSFLSSLTLSAYLKVFRVCSQHEFAGDTFAIIVVLLLPVNESLST